MQSSYFLHKPKTFLTSIVRNTGERWGHGKSILIWPSEVGRDKRQLLMPSQIFHVATIALMISSQTNGKHTDRPQQNGREVTCMACWWWHHFLISPHYCGATTFPECSRAWILKITAKAPADNTSKNMTTALPCWPASLVRPWKWIWMCVCVSIDAEMWMREKERCDLCLTTHFPQ